MKELNHLIAIEVKAEIIKTAEIIEILETATKIYDYSSTMIIFDNQKDCKAAEEILDAASLFEELHNIVEIPSPNILFDVFEDYGFKSNSGNTYLLSDTVSYFYVNKGADINIKMGILQCEEHLITQTTTDERILYFFDSQLKSLISNISIAYDIEVSILDLDK